MYVCMYVFVYPSSAHSFGPIGMKLPGHFQWIEIHLLFWTFLLAGNAKRAQTKRVRCEHEAHSVRNEVTKNASAKHVTGGRKAIENASIKHESLGSEATD